MRKRGGYSGNLRHQIKVRVSDEMYIEIDNLSEERQLSVAGTIREILRHHLKPKSNKSGVSSRIVGP